jgi:hypothetical protein
MRKTPKPGRFTPVLNFSVFSTRLVSETDNHIFLNLEVNSNGMTLAADWWLQGVVASALAFAVQTWVIDRAGPVFASVYLPVQTLLVAVMASVVLGEEFYLGGWVSSPYLIFFFFP